MTVQYNNNLIFSQINSYRLFNQLGYGEKVMRRNATTCSSSRRRRVRTDLGFWRSGTTDFMLCCILKQVQIRNVKVNLCHWRADHGWILTGHIHHTQTHMQSLPRLSDQLVAQLSTPIPFCICLSQARPRCPGVVFPRLSGCWEQALCLTHVSLIPCALCSAWHLIRIWKCQMNEWTSYSACTEVPWEAPLALWTHRQAGLNVRKPCNCIAERESKENK